MKKIILFLFFNSIISFAYAENTWLNPLLDFKKHTEPTVQNVTLQLKWLHGFQFAGYYAALEKGYYRDAGFNVNISEGKPEQNLIDNVITGKTEFGVGTSDLLLLKAKQQKITVLAVIFQHSPIALMYKKGGNITSIHDIVGKKVAMDFAFEGEIDGFLKHERIDPQSFTKTTLTDNVNALINGDIDMMAVYSIDEPFFLQQKNIQYGLFSPREGGVDFYGDNLFTSETYLKSHPKQAKAFIEASIKGWQYAMDHPNEMIDLILKKYSQRYSREHLQFQYQQMLPLIQPKLVEMGYMHEGRWRHIANTYSELGLLPPNFSLKGFLYEKNPKPNLIIFYWGMGLLSTGLLLFWGLSSHRARLNKKLTIKITHEVEKNHQQKQHFIEQLEQANKRLEQQVIIRTADLNNTLEKLQTLLDNSGEGFLAFDQNMNIDIGYSQECHQLFNTTIANKKINQLLFPNQITEQHNFQKNMQRILKETDEFKQTVLLSLLPNQFKLNQKIISVTYKPLTNHTMMMKMVDITESEILKQQLINEKQHLLFIVEIISDPKEFFILADDYQHFIQYTYKDIVQQNKTITEKTNQLYREIHTFKGIFLQKFLLDTPIALHNIETDLSQLRHQQCNENDLMQLLEKHQLLNQFENDLNYLRIALGEHYFNKKDTIQISEQALKDSIAYAKQLNNQLPLSEQNVNHLIKKIKQLRFVDIKTLLNNYNKTVQQLATRLNKKIAEFTIEGDSIFIDPDDFYPFTKSLIHLFRNIVDHAIEYPEQREELEKPEQGHIHCKIEKQPNHIKLTITDDGTGINIEALKQKALNLGLYNADQLKNFTEQQSLMLMFEQHLSTKKQIDLISGQGVGLASVYAELKKRQGNVSVTTQLGRGTTFTFTLPLHYD